ncbi:hypothetical protein HYV12_00550 [Candidatus Dojkabacteria bacterium]|nr:hypothetical protein [Candidatus Dojkabacteria bacterium]
MQKQVILEKLSRLMKSYQNGEIPLLHTHEVNPSLDKSSRENYLYFTMTCSLNFQRNSPKTWESALKTWNDKDTQFVFFPEKVVITNTEDLRQALLKHKLALQPNKHIEIWGKISKTFNSDFNNDPRELFKRGEHNTDLVLEIVRKEMKSKFPYLSGPKLSNYFIYILLYYSDLKLKNTINLSIIPDTHIMQATEHLGILENRDIKPEKVEEAWKELLKGSTWAPVDFHPVLWNWSRNHFVPNID